MAEPEYDVVWNGTLDREWSRRDRRDPPPQTKETAGRKALSTPERDYRRARDYLRRRGTATLRMVSGHLKSGLVRAKEAVTALEQKSLAVQYVTTSGITRWRWHTAKADEGTSPPPILYDSDGHKICRACKKRFEKERSRYCSETCRRELERQRKKAYRPEE